MTVTNTALLETPGVLSVTGADARKLLQGLITNDMDKLKADGDAIHAALLSPQGKILFVFFVIQSSEGFLIETRRETAADLSKRLGFYKLRAAATIEDVSERYGLAVGWSPADPLSSPPALWGRAKDGGVPSPSAGAQPPPQPSPVEVEGGASAARVFRDPRHLVLGWRRLGPAVDMPTANATTADYNAHRIALGVPEPGVDYPLGDTYPHEADFDHFDGADFDKGCYVGQEVVARMQHKTVVRKRVVRVSGGEPLPADHPDVLAGSVAIGRLGTVARAQGLALLRLDRVVEALGKGDALTTGGLTITVDADDLQAYRQAAAARAAAS